ncbi:hypothetical protein DP741_25060 [Salmonella enterica subsp. enterica serovar Kentucky]|nr:hypothetical protein [Salmonella enterica subsp. enterica serovar Kentucky]
MAKLGENTPHIIDATVDFMASSQAFREYLRKLPPDHTIPPDLTDEHVPLYIRRLGNDSNLLIVFYVQIMPDDFVMQLHRF